MLYIKFKIKDLEKISVFQQLFQYLIKNHKEDYLMKEYEDFMDLEERLQSRALTLYYKLFPDYAQLYLEKYFEYINRGNNSKEENITNLFCYLDVDFEICFTDLILNGFEGTILFSAKSYPFGGLDFFLSIMKAFDLVPIEFYNGFHVCNCIWNSDFDFEVKELPEKTQHYLQKYKS